MGVGGITVKVYDAENSEIDNTTTGDDGNYTLNITQDGDYRIEFNGWADYLKESFDGNISNSSIRFAKNGDTINFGLHNPDDFSSTANPQIVTSIALEGSTSAKRGDNRAIVKWEYTNLNDEDFTKIIEKQDIGSTWGIAYKKDTQDIFVSAFLRRHIGLPDNDNDGNGDIGVIYKIDSSNSKEIFYR